MALKLKNGIFLAPFHPVDEDPTLCIQRDLELVEHLDRLGYEEAWIGEHHSAGFEIIASPEVFIAACMSLAINNTDRLAALKQEAEYGGLTILPPDINRSEADFSVERSDDGRLAIRYALAGVECTTRVTHVDSNGAVVRTA